MLKGKVLIAHGEELRKQGLAGQLVNRGFLVLTAEGSDDVPERVLAETPDIIVLDDAVPGLDGPHLCREIRRTSVAAIILLSASSDEADVVQGLGMGADYYLPKPVKLSEVVAYVEAAARRRTTYSRGAVPERVQIKDLIIDIPTHELRRDGVMIPLSITEFKIVRALATNAGRILTRDDLLNCVWDVKSQGVYSRTVDVHIARIRRKMGDSATNQRYIKTIPGFGYKLLAG